MTQYCVHGPLQQIKEAMSKFNKRFKNNFCDGVTLNKKKNTCSEGMNYFACNFKIVIVLQHSVHIKAISLMAVILRLEL